MGHSKWAKTKVKKAVTDAQKSKLFTKIVRLITIEAKKSNGDTNAPGLRIAIEKAREANMPNENIERAIKKATEAGDAMEHITYEAYGPGGVAIVIEALTDSRNKAAQEIRHILSEHGTTLSGIGSVTWAFSKKGNEWEPTSTVVLNSEDQLLLEALVEDLENNDEVQDIFTNNEIV